MLAILFMCISVLSQTVPVLKLNAYYGRWYQVYTDFTVKSTFEYNIICDSAYYYPYSNNTIAVVNSGNYGSYDGNLSIVKGWANQPDSSVPGKLSVHLQPTGGFPAPYWIYQLGPIVNGQYDYSIVSDDIKLTLFVLARNYTRFINSYNKDVVNWLFANGFNEWYNSPILTNQTNCVYPEIYY